MVLSDQLRRRRSSSTPVIRRLVELVVVHGMGRQRSNETLLEWAEPLLRRIDWIARQNPVARADQDTETDFSLPMDDPTVEKTEIRFGEVVVSTQGEGVVTAEVEYRAAGNEHRFLSLRITEARWSESFLGMKRSEIFTWGLSFAPHTITRLGAHFTRVIWYGTRNHPFRTVVPGLIGIGVLWLILVAAGIVVIVFLAVVGPLLFIPVLAGALGSIVDTLVEFVGDVAVWNRRPVRAAAMRLVVRETLEAAQWRLQHSARAHPKAETELIALAHSQGAAVTASVLFNGDLREPRTGVDTFISVGAAVTLLGSPSWDGRTRPAAASDRVASAPSNIVRSWARHPQIRWLNFWGIWDPFAAGPISTGSAARKQRWLLTLGIGGAGHRQARFIGPEEHALHNTAWPFSDHQSYSSNVVQVIDPVSRMVMNLPDEPDETDDSAAFSRRNELHARSVREFGTQRLLVIAIAVSCLTVPGLLLFLESQLLPFGGWVAKWVRLLLAQDATTGFLSWISGRAWFAPALLAVVVLSLGLWFNSLLWHKRAGRIAWLPTHQLPGRIWVGGVILRCCLVTILGAGDVAAVLLLPGIGGWRLVIIAALVAVAAGVVIAPSWSALPVVVRANRVELND